MRLGQIKIKTTVSSPYEEVKSAFVDKSGKLLNFLVPMGSKLVHYKGVRRGAITKIKVFGNICTFKIATYSTSKNQLTFKDFLKDGDMFGVKFWSHVHKIKSLSKNKSIIIDEVTFTTRSKKKDFLLHVLFLTSFVIRCIKYKVFFLFRR